MAQRMLCFHINRHLLLARWRLFRPVAFLLMSSQQRFQHRSYRVWAVAFGSFTRVLPPRYGGQSRMNRRLQPTNKQGSFRGCCKRRLSCCAMTACIVHEACNHACCTIYHHSLECSLTHKVSKNRRQYSESNTEAVLGHAGSSCAPRTTWGQYCL